jgi:predicted RNase H-like nuclease (RuvC/YqgF family)
MVDMNAEVQRMAELAGRYELLWRRTVEGARSANKGLERAQRKAYSLECSLTIAEGEIERLRHEKSELSKKLERLSLKIMEMWSRE